MIFSAPVRHLLTVLLIALLWGMNWPAVKFMLTELPPFTIRAVALTLAAVVLAGYALATGEKMRPLKGEWPGILVTGLFIVFGFNVLTTFGQLQTETAKAAIIAFTMPAFTAVLAAVFLQEKLGKWGLAALLIGMGGLAVLASEDFAALISAPVGPFIMLMAALSWACGNVALKSRQWSLSPLALTVWFFIVSSLACWPFVLVFEPPWAQSLPSAPVLMTLAYHSFGPMVICYVLWTRLVGRISATIASISVLAVPPVGVTSSIILLDNPLTWQKVIALAMILASILMTQLPQKASQATDEKIKPARYRE